VAYFFVERWRIRGLHCPVL